MTSLLRRLQPGKSCYPIEGAVGHIDTVPRLHDIKSSFNMQGNGAVMSNVPEIKLPVPISGTGRPASPPWQACLSPFILTEYLIDRQAEEPRDGECQPQRGR
jgi:hypothetical protein